MRPLDWAVLAASLAGIVIYGLYKGRGSGTVREYLLAGKTMPWYAMALSIMATQASAITFISTTGQAYVDGMRFVQFYLGLPPAMVILSATAAPIFHRANVYTAYEYLELRFDAKTRALVSLIFLIQRGLGVGLALYAPAVVLTVMLGWPDRLTILLMGGLVILYTVLGGIKAVTWTDVQQMLIIFAGLLAALAAALWLLPQGVTPLDALRLAGAAGKLNAVDLSLDPRNRYTLWSGLVGGMFLALSYFGTDQSQVQRYLTGRSIGQSRLSLLFNAVAKVPMQFLVLLIGALVFVFFVFEKPPVLFHPTELARLRQADARWPALEARFEEAFRERRQAAWALIEAHRNGEQSGAAAQAYRAAEQRLQAVRREAAGGVNDANYIFLSFVTRYLPAGLVGLILAAVFAAAMSTISAEINSLATVTVIDLYRRHVRPQAGDRECLRASRLATAFWGCYAVIFAQYGRNLGSLIEAVNMVGSLFYGPMLGVFALAFWFARVRGGAAFTAVLAGEAAVLWAHFFSGISFLWYNVLGCLVTVGTGLAVARALEEPRRVQKL
jgi:SSS family transporter